MDQASGVFRMVLEIDVTAGRTGEFEEVWRSVADTIAAEPGNLGQWLLRDTERPERYAIVSDWDDEARFWRFESSQGHVENRRRLAAYRDDGTMTTLHVLADHRGAGA